MVEVPFERDFYMDLDRFLKFSEGCFFVFYKGGRCDIVCDKLEQEFLFNGDKRNVCLFVPEGSPFESTDKDCSACSIKNTFIGSFYDFAYDFLRTNVVCCDLEGYKTEEYVNDVINDLFSSESIFDKDNVVEVKNEFYKRESVQLYRLCEGNNNEELLGTLYKEVFGKNEVARKPIENLKDEAFYSKYLKRKQQLGFLDGEDVLFLLYQQLQNHSHLRDSFSRLLRDVLVLDFSTLTFLQRIILKECFSKESLYVFLIEERDCKCLNDDFKSKMSESFPGCFFLDVSSYDYSGRIFECANLFLARWNKTSVFTQGCDIKKYLGINDCDNENPLSIKKRCSDRDSLGVDFDEDRGKVITFLSSTIESKEVDLVSMVIREIVKEDKACFSDIIVFTTCGERDAVVSRLKEDGVKVSVKGSIGVRVEDIRDARRVDNIVKYVFIYGLSSSGKEIAEEDFYFALLSAAKKIFLSYSLMRNVGGEIVNLVKSEFIDMLDSRFVNEDVLTASKIALLNKDYSFYNKATIFSYSFIQKKSVVRK